MTWFYHLTGLHDQGMFTIYGIAILLLYAVVVGVLVYLVRR